MIDKDFIMEMNNLHMPSYAPLGSRNFRRLMYNGIFVAFADGLLFNDKAYLFVGGSNSGKTSIVRMFNNYNKNSRILSEDSSTIAIGDILSVYDTIRSPRADLNPVLSNNLSYDLDAIISLGNDHSVNNIILRMFNGKSSTDACLINKYFDNARIIAVPWQRLLRDRYVMIKKMIMYYG